MKYSHAIKLWAVEWLIVDEADSLVYHPLLSISIIFINIQPQATAWKRSGAHIKEHQCDKRLLHSIQDSIRNVDAHEINLATCNITNFVKYGEILCCDGIHKKLPECVYAKMKKPIVLRGFLSMSFHQLRSWIQALFPSASPKSTEIRETHKNCEKKRNIFRVRMVFVACNYIRKRICFQLSVCWSGFSFPSSLRIFFFLR